MLSSLFVLNKNGATIIEKNWRVGATRNVCEAFWCEVEKCEGNFVEVPPIITTSRHYLVSIQRAELFFLGVVETETNPMVVIEFLQRIYETLGTYFRVSEINMKENFVTVYQVLDEMMDDGIPFTTEPNILHEIIKPANIVSKVLQGVTGKSSVQDTLPDGILSSVPWRKANAKHTTNEVFFDLVEELSAIVDRDGVVVSTDVQGEILCNSKLSGMPDLTMRFHDCSSIDDCTFHPCVRISQWEREKALSFVPPDGNFRLMSYRSNKNVEIPVYVRPQITFGSNGGTVNVMAGPRNTTKVVENVTITIPFPKTVTSADLTATYGSVHYDEMTKVCLWNIGKIPKDKSPCLSGSISFPPVAAPEETPAVNAKWSISSFAVSGLSVESVVLHRETYAMYKGIRSHTRAGNFQIRT